MSEFKFALSQRVSLPGDGPEFDGVQGIVSSRQEFIGGVNEYHVHYMQPDMKLAHIIVPEDVLMMAQPPEMVSADYAAEMVIRARANVTAELGMVIRKQGINIRNLRASVLRQHKGKPARRRRRR